MKSPRLKYQKLRSVQVQFPEDIHEKQMLNQFLRGSHRKYQASIIQEYKSNPNVTVDSLADTLQVDHRLTSVFSTQVAIEDESIEYEYALVQPEANRPSYTPRSGAMIDTEKICYLCRKKGHIMRNCPGATG